MFCTKIECNTYFPGLLGLYPPWWGKYQPEPDSATFDDSLAYPLDVNSFINLIWSSLNVLVLATFQWCQSFFCLHFGACKLDIYSSEWQTDFAVTIDKLCTFLQNLKKSFIFLRCPNHLFIWRVMGFCEIVVIDFFSAYLVLHYRAPCFPLERNEYHLV